MPARLPDYFHTFFLAGNFRSPVSQDNAGIIPDEQARETPGVYGSDPFLF